MDVLITEKRGAVTLFRLNRPEVLNALNAEVMYALIAGFAAFEADPGQRCAILTGNDKAFAAGADIREFERKGFSEMFGGDPYAGFERVCATRKPWIAAVSGLALGGGCELAMMADILVAAENARFGQPEIKLGISPGMGGSQRLARAVGKVKAMEMCLTGRTMDAHEAERTGLAVRVVPVEGLLEEALRIAEAVAAMPPLAALANKEMVNHAFETHLSAGLLYERRMFNGLCATRDKDEGIAAFVERRAGTWTGR